MREIQRSECPVLIAEAHTLGSIAVIRSLGRAGYPVHSCSADPDAMGFASRYSSVRVVAPEYEEPGFNDWLLEYVRTQGIRAIVPSEGMLLAIRPHFREFAPFLPFSPVESVVYAGMSKADQFEIFATGPDARTAGNHLPPFFLWTDPQPIPTVSELDQLGLPLFLKVDACHARGRSGGAVHKSETLAQAEAILRDLVTRYRKVLIQGYAPGRGTGAFALLWDAQLRAEFMHIRVHEVPHTGGVSSYRKTWSHPEMRADALAKLRAINWQGVAMMEYRWDRSTDRFCFMEMNGRFWGSLHLALHAGVDFPALLLDAFQGAAPRDGMRPAKNVSCRYTFPRDAMYVWSCWKDSNLKWHSKFAVLCEFIALSLNPAVRSDLWFAGDRRLYWRGLGRFLKGVIGDALTRKKTAVKTLPYEASH